MSERAIGKFKLGNRTVELCVDETVFGGHFTLTPESGVARIVVGIQKGKPWQDVLSVFMHEAMEMAMVDGGVRFSPSPDYANDHAGYLFVMKHTEFAEANARAAWFVAEGYEAMVTAFRKVVLVKKKP